MAKGVFIVGTDTDVGKTIITAGIMYLLRKNGHNATYFKAALSGALEVDGGLIPGNAMACAIALEGINILEEDNIIDCNKEKGMLINKLTLEKFKDCNHIGEVRSIGMITAIEIVKNKKTKELYPWNMRIGYEIYKIALKKGLILRPIGNVLYFIPPYVINEKEIRFMINTCFENVEEYLKKH